MKVFRTTSEIETVRVAHEIARSLKGGDVVALTGELGAGKTTFVRGLARALGIRARVTSPTFLLMRCYALPRGKSRRGIRHLCHVDAYRVRGAKELQSVGIEEYLTSPDTVTLIEWADRVRSILPRRLIHVRFRYGNKIDERTIVVERD
ncbi:MAG: tRNA (adenosine(37)-N6)-threonylcarbamoyltransferase complex ATPase subunit type 1 TsaE [Patescibacteria group bacterium]